MSRHPFDPVSFVFGALFMITGMAVLGTWFDVRDADNGWLAPFAIVVLGLGLLSSAINRRSVGGDDRRDGSPVVNSTDEPDRAIDRSDATRA